MNSAGKKRAVPPETDYEIEESGGVLESTAPRPAGAHASDFVAVIDHGGIIPSSRSDVLEANGDVASRYPRLRIRLNLASSA